MNIIGLKLAEEGFKIINIHDFAYMQRYMPIYTSQNVMRFIESNLFLQIDDKSPYVTPGINSSLPKAVL